MFRCVIFDMDGVISDSEPLHHIAERQLLATYGIRISQAQLESYTGIGLYAMLERFQSEFHLDTSIQPLAERHNQNLMDIFRERVDPVPHALDLIHDLHKSGLTLAVGSSSSRQLIELVLEKLEILHYFKTVISGQEVPNGKPHPDIFLAIADCLDVDPNTCVVIEDSRNGVAAAKAAGMTCIGFRSPNSPRQDLSTADQIVYDLSEISIKTMEELFSSRRN